MNQLRKASTIFFIITSTALLLSSASTFAEYSQKQNEIIDPHERNTAQQYQSNTSSNQGADSKQDQSGSSASSHNNSNSDQIGTASISSNRYAKKMMDMDVVSNNDEKIGTVEDFALNNDNKIEYAIVSVGGFLGVGDKLVAVPFKNLRVNHNEEKIILDATKQQLEQANEFKYKQ